MTVAVWLAQFGIGAALAALFDWAVMYSVNIARLPTRSLRWKATLSAFSFHGPWFAFAFPLFLGGALATKFETLGMSPELAVWASLPAFGVLGGTSILLIRRIPAVRRIAAEVDPLVKAAHADSNRAFARAVGVGAKGKGNSQ